MPDWSTLDNNDTKESRMRTYSVTLIALMTCCFLVSCSEDAPQSKVSVELDWVPIDAVYVMMDPRSGIQWYLMVYEEKYELNGDNWRRMLSANKTFVEQVAFLDNIHVEDTRQVHDDHQSMLLCRVKPDLAVTTDVTRSSQSIFSKLLRASTELELSIFTLVTEGQPTEEWLESFARAVIRYDAEQRGIWEQVRTGTIHVSKRYEKSSGLHDEYTIEVLYSP